MFKFLLFDRWTCLPNFFYEFQNSAPAEFSTGDHLGLPGLNMDGVPAACVPFYLLDEIIDKECDKT